MRKIVDWVKSNKLSAVLILVLAFLLFKNIVFGILGTISSTRMSYTGNGVSFDMATPTANIVGSPMLETSKRYAPAPKPGGGAAPRPDVEERMVVTKSSISVVVSKVRESIDRIQEETELRGGYMVERSDRVTDSVATGKIVFRVPVEHLKSIMQFLRDMSVRVVSENISGQDVTDQYIDIEERLAALYRTKNRYEAIMDKAEDVDEIMRVLQRIQSLQDQIDRLKGQKQKLEGTSITTAITVHLSTDEYELPFTPDEPWSAKNVFKRAVRSLIKTLRAVAEFGIWVGVYAVVWAPVIVLFKGIKKLRKRKKEETVKQL